LLRLLLFAAFFYIYSRTLPDVLDAAKR